jgi:hypothetical protein
VLIGVNLLLLALLILGGHSPPMAYAQTSARAGDFLCVTANVAGQSYDALYVLDLPSRKLYAFYPTDARSNQLVATQPRDLLKDFGR